MSLLEKAVLAEVALVLPQRAVMRGAGVAVLRVIDLEVDWVIGVG
jgi:hypothetical protein